METRPFVSAESAQIADRVLLILKLSGSGWSYDMTVLSATKSATPSFGGCKKLHYFKTFWFKLDEVPVLRVGFDWASDNPNIVKTRCGAFPHLTPINLGYVTSNKKLAEFFNSSRDSFLHYRQEQQEKDRELKRFKPLLSRIWKKTLVILTTPIG